jgi:RND family efflux transporter MFP subunit
VLARLDDAALEAALRAARAAAAAERAGADDALAELRRARELGDTVAQSERDRWSAESAAREARAARSDAEIGRLEAVLAQGVLHAPFAGTIVARRVTLGSHAAAGATAFELVDLAALEAWLELPAEIAGLARAGDRVTLEAPGGELELPLDAIVPATEPGARTFRAVARFAGSAAPGLLPGAFVRARLVLRAAAGLVVPVDALLETAGGTTLVCAEAGADGAPDTARLVPVRVLARGADGNAAVAPLEPGALAAGARVVVTGCDNVFPGAPLLLQPHRAARP